MKKEFNRKPVAVFNYDTGQFVKGTDVSKLRALIFNTSPKYHNPMLDLIKSRMTAKEVLEFIDHMDRNPSLIRLYQMIQSFCSHFTENDKLLNAALVLQNAILEKSVDQKRNLHSELQYIKSQSHEDEHYDMLYSWKEDEYRIPACKSEISETSARLLIQLAQLFKQGLPIDETQKIWLEEKKEKDREIESLLAQYKISKAEHAQMFKFAMSYHDRKLKAQEETDDMQKLLDELAQEINDEHSKQ